MVSSETFKIKAQWLRNITSEIYICFLQEQIACTPACRKQKVFKIQNLTHPN